MSWTLKNRHDGIVTTTSWEGCGAPGPWLIVVPHDDDLVLGMGLAVLHAQGQGIEVSVAVVSDGRMGYYDPADRQGTPATRHREMVDSCAQLGIPASRIHELGYPDGDLPSCQGCRVGPGGGISGIAYDLTALMRRLAPRSVFGPTRADLHPDHVAVAEDLAIACFHAAGEIWHEHGAPIAVPRRFDYAVYCPFPGPPTIELRSPAEAFERKLRAIASFASQRQIASLVATVRANGAVEYLQQATWSGYQSESYRALFSSEAATGEGGRGFRADCARALPLLEAWDAQPWPELVAAFCASPQTPLLLIGEGSSRLFPAALASALAMESPRRIRFEHRGGRECQTLPLAQYRLLLVSNSGRTRELIELASSLPPEARAGALAMVGVGGGELTRLIPHSRVLLSVGEIAVAATVSVVAQAMTIAHALCAAAGMTIPWRELRAAMAQAQRLQLPQDIQRVARIWWSGGEHGACGELALKTMETTGLTGIHLPGTMVLHGIEEVLTASDLVVVFFPDQRDLATIERRLGATGARLLVIAPGGELSLPGLGRWNGMAELLAGWSLLEQLAGRRGHDADVPRRARKVGNEYLAAPR